MGETSDYLRSSGKWVSPDSASAKTGVRKEHVSGISIIGSFFLGFLIAAILGFCMYWFSGDGTNVIESSTLWGGYSEINVRQIYDANTGVMYAVTDTGDICVMLDENGKPRMVD